MRAIAQANTITRWFSLLMLLACGSILYLAPSLANAGPVSNAVPTRLLPTPAAPINAPLPVKRVEVPTPAPAIALRRCQVVERTEVWSQPGFGAYVQGHQVDICGCSNCGKQVSIPDIAVGVQGQTLTSTTTKEICN